LEAVFLLGVWQGFCKSQWRSTWKSPAKGPLNLKMMPRLSYFSGNWCSQTYPILFGEGCKIMLSRCEFVTWPEWPTAEPWPHPPRHDDSWIWSSRAKRSWLELLLSQGVFSARLDNESSWASSLSERERVRRAILICTPACTLLIFQTTN
jgi:hypothetical protein